MRTLSVFALLVATVAVGVGVIALVETRDVAAFSGLTAVAFAGIPVRDTADWAKYLYITSAVTVSLGLTVGALGIRLWRRRRGSLFLVVSVVVASLVLLLLILDLTSTILVPVVMRAIVEI